MVVRQSLFSGNSKYLLGLLICSFIAFVTVVLASSSNDKFDLARREILIRKIGHEILLKSGDSTSRVLPVKKVAPDEYQISFENKFAFEPDFLISVVSRNLEKDPISANYVVNVFKRGTNNVIYGFAIANNKANDIISCNGRTQPSENYVINVKFEPQGVITEKGAYLLGGLPFLALIGLVFFRSTKNKNESETIMNTPLFTLGSTKFYRQNKKLVINGGEVDLTATETRLLLIFASSPNTVIERNRFQKEIWEDEGVIVGRSLDMFISKLRKKLEPDPNVNIVVVRGKGYKLEVGD